MAGTVPKKGTAKLLPNPLEALLGPSYLAFLQTVYDAVFDVVSDADTGFTIGNSEVYKEYAEGMMNEEEPYDLPEANYHHLIPGPNMLRALIPSSDSAPLYNTVMVARVGDFFRVVLTFKESTIKTLDPATQYLNDWVRLAIYGLQRAGGHIKSQLEADLADSVYSQFLDHIRSVKVSSSNASELNTMVDPETDPFLEVTIEFSFSS
jgi:hypothetical protein